LGRLPIHRHAVLRYCGNR